MSSFRILLDVTVLPGEWWGLLGALTTALFVLFSWQLRGLLLSRAVALCAIALLFVTPYVSRALLSPMPPIALVMADQNLSEPAHAALTMLQEKLRAQENLQVERYDVTSASEIMPLLKKYNSEQLAAVFFITDNHAPPLPGWPSQAPPLQVLSDGVVPDVQWVTGRQNRTDDFLALWPSRAMISTGVSIDPLLPKGLLLFLVIGALAFGWWRESR